MKKGLVILLVVATVGLQGGCDLLDPTNVTNPDLTEEAVVGTAQSLNSWVRGMERQLDVALNNYVVVAEIGSDNYVNTQTFFNQFFDQLAITYEDDDVDDILFTFSDLRAMAVFGAEVIAPGDEGTTDDQRAELAFFEGIASLYLGEVFHSAPLEPAGPAAASQAHLERAIAAFEQAISLSSDADKVVGYRIALARANYDLGNKSAAVSQAQQALNADPDYVRFAMFDPVNQPDNDMQDALFDRGGFDDLQPLPRLDFLDPKYYAVSGTEDVDIPYLKAEEAHLILIEAALSDGDLEGAKTQMQVLLDLVATRPLATFDDNVEDRTERNPGTRPNASGFVIRASEQDLFREGLVLSRKDGLVSVPTVSGTSVTSDMVNDLSSIDDAVQMLYLMRQEIFIAEGRRFVDLGIKIPVSDDEELANDNISVGSETEPIIPSFLPPGPEIDAFTVDFDTQQATIQHNLNRILAQNRSAPEVVPFF